MERQTKKIPKRQEIHLLFSIFLLAIIPAIINANNNNNVPF